MYGVKNGNLVALAVFSEARSIYVIFFSVFARAFACYRGVNLHRNSFLLGEIDEICHFCAEKTSRCAV